MCIPSKLQCKKVQIGTESRMGTPWVRENTNITFSLPPLFTMRLEGDTTVVSKTYITTIQINQLKDQRYLGGCRFDALHLGTQNFGILNHNSLTFIKALPRPIELLRYNKVCHIYFTFIGFFLRETTDSREHGIQ